MLGFAGLIVSFMQTLLIPIQGELPQLLGASRNDTAWAITITLFVGAISMPISGRLGDMFGKRRVAMWLLCLLVAGSVVAALSDSILPLIIARGLQGIGLGVVPLGTSMMRDVIPPHRLGSSVAVMSATLGVGGAIGLPVSGFVAERFDWHVLFWVSAVIGAVSLLLIGLIVPASTVRTPGRFDFAGAIGLTAGLAGVMLAISRGEEWGWTSPSTLALGAGGVVVLLLWGYLELRIQRPLVDLRVNIRSTVLLTNLASIAMGFALYASNVAYAQLLVQPDEAGGIGLSLLHAGLILMPAGLMTLLMAPLVGRLHRRIGAKPLLIGGAIVLSAAYATAALLELEWWHVLIINAVNGVGIGLGYAAMPILVIQAVPVTETGSANGLNTLMRALGTAVAAAMVGSVLAHSAVAFDGVSYPTEDGFRLSFILGMIAAALAALIAAFIPRRTRSPGGDSAFA